MTLFYLAKGFKSMCLPFCQSPGLLIVIFCDGEVLCTRNIQYDKA